jgi:RNA polymerase sigma factor (sigma-70 family)
LDEESRAHAQEAFVELYRRHAAALFHLLKDSGEGQLVKKFRGENALHALVDDTFLRACKRAGTYDPEKSEVRTWLVSVARNLANDVLEEETRQIGEADRADMEQEDLERTAAMALYEIGDTKEYNSDLIEIIRDALEEELTERQWELLLPYLVIQAQGESRDGADKGAVSQLAARLDTTPSHLRANKSRSQEKIEEYLRERVPERVPD